MKRRVEKIAEEIVCDILVVDHFDKHDIKHCNLKAAAWRAYERAIEDAAMKLESLTYPVPMPSKAAADMVRALADEEEKP